MANHLRANLRWSVRLGVLVAALLTSNRSYSADDKQICYFSNEGTARSNEVRLDACNRVLSRPGLAKAELAIAYFSRGLAWVRKGEFDIGIRDYSAAIDMDIAELQANAYYNRGRAYQRKGDVDGAMQDYEETIKLNPNL